MQKLPRLNLPPFEIKTSWIDGNQQIWDIIRKQHVVLTPEEWVRQHFVHLLVESLQYPKGLFKIESSLNYDKKRKRSDIQVLDRDGKVFLLVECKSPAMKLDEKTLKQVAEYNHSVQASYLSITNGLKHFIWVYDPDKNSFDALSEFPTFPTG